MLPELAFLNADGTLVKTSRLCCLARGGAGQLVLANSAWSHTASIHSSNAPVVLAHKTRLQFCGSRAGMFRRESMPGKYTQWLQGPACQPPEMHCIVPGQEACQPGDVAVGDQGHFERRTLIAALAIGGGVTIDKCSRGSVWVLLS